MVRKPFTPKQFYTIVGAQGVRMDGVEFLIDIHNN
jgi:hypothetical protein